MAQPLLIHVLQPHSTPHPNPQAHHDHCAFHDLPTAVREGFHDLQDVCHDANCDIAKTFDPSRPQCPTPSCENATSTLAPHQYLLDNCLASCSSDACAAAFHRLQAHHDLCEEGDLHVDVRGDYHDLADLCEPYACNTATGDVDPNECHPHEHEDDDHDHDDHDHDDHDHDDDFLVKGVSAHGRLVLTDAVSSDLHFYDVDLEEWHSEALPGAPIGATLPKHTADGRYLTLLSRSRDAVRFADSGLNVVADAHGASVVRGTPHIESVQFSDESPGHVESSFGWLVVFFDGSLYVDTDHPDHKVRCRRLRGRKRGAGRRGKLDSRPSAMLALVRAGAGSPSTFHSSALHPSLISPAPSFLTPFPPPSPSPAPWPAVVGRGVSRDGPRQAF